MLLNNSLLQERGLSEEQGWRLIGEVFSIGLSAWLASLSGLTVLFFFFVKAFYAPLRREVNVFLLYLPINKPINPDNINRIRLKCHGCSPEDGPIMVRR